MQLLDGLFFVHGLVHLCRLSPDVIALRKARLYCLGRKIAIKGDFELPAVNFKPQIGMFPSGSFTHNSVLLYK